MPPRYDQIEGDEVVLTPVPIQVPNPVETVLTDIANMKDKYSSTSKRNLSNMVLCSAKGKHIQSNVVLYVKVEFPKGFLTEGLLGLTAMSYASLVGKANTWMQQRASNINGTVLHNVEFTDNIQGLAIRYRTTPSRIRALNNLPNGNIFGRQTLIVPATAGTGPAASANSNSIYEDEEPQQGQEDESSVASSTTPPNPNFEEFQGFVQLSIFSAFQARTQLSDDECKAILQLNDFNLPYALKDFDESKQWQSAINRSAPQTLLEFIQQQHQRSSVENMLRKNSKSSQ